MLSFKYMVKSGQNQTNTIGNCATMLSDCLGGTSDTVRTYQTSTEFACIADPMQPHSSCLSCAWIVLRRCLGSLM